MVGTIARIASYEKAVIAYQQRWNRRCVS